MNNNAQVTPRVTGRYLSIETVTALFGSAMDAGCRPEVREDYRGFKRSIKWHVAGRCQEPRELVFWSRFHVSTKQGVPIGVRLMTMCRHCRWCLMHRRHHWATAAVNEVKSAPRTWFITLTCNPGAHHRMLSSIRAAYTPTKEYPDYDSLPHERRFRELLRLIRPHRRGDAPPDSYSRALTLFLKRIRKNSGTKFRYLLVAERHQSGLPHFHMLLHETDAPIRKRVIRAAWPLGFSKVVLCEGSRGAVYLCKYLAKDASTRVRASFKYGKDKGLLPHDTLEEHSDSVESMTPQKTALEMDGSPSLSRGDHFEGFVLTEWTDEISEELNAQAFHRVDDNGSSSEDEPIDFDEEDLSFGVWP